jgi:hypothetical protein
VSWLKKIEDYIAPKALKYIGGQEHMAIQLDITAYFGPCDAAVSLQVMPRFRSM